MLHSFAGGAQGERREDRTLDAAALSVILPLSCAMVTMKIGQMCLSIRQLLCESHPTFQSDLSFNDGVRGDKKLNQTVS